MTRLKLALMGNSLATAVAAMPLTAHATPYAYASNGITGLTVALSNGGSIVPSTATTSISDSAQFAGSTPSGFPGQRHGRQRADDYTGLLGAGRRTRGDVHADGARQLHRGARQRQHWRRLGYLGRGVRAQRGRGLWQCARELRRDEQCRGSVSSLRERVRQSCCPSVISSSSPLPPPRCRARRPMPRSRTTSPSRPRDRARRSRVLADRYQPPNRVGRGCASTNSVGPTTYAETFTSAPLTAGGHTTSRSPRRQVRPSSLAGPSRRRNPHLWR